MPEQHIQITCDSITSTMQDVSILALKLDAAKRMVGNIGQFNHVESQDASERGRSEATSDQAIRVNDGI